MISTNLVENQIVKDFDPIAFESEREEIFNRTEINSRKYQIYSEDFSSGSWDGILGNEPQDSQLLSEQYRAGYLSGVEKRFEKRLADLSAA